MNNSNFLARLLLELNQVTWTKETNEIYIKLCQPESYFIFDLFLRIMKNDYYILVYVRILLLKKIITEQL